MARGKKDVVEFGVMKDAEEGKNEGNAPQIEGNVPKTPKSPKSIVVDLTMDVSRMIQYDSEGAELLFEQTERFLTLSEDTVRQLSRENRARYSTARQFHDTWRGQKDVDFAESFAVDREYVGSATDKLNELTVRAGIKTRWARPDRIQHYIEKGYKMISPDEATTFLGSKGTRHEVSRNGKTELVLMGIPKPMFDAAQKKKVQKNLDLAASWKTTGVERIAETGTKGFVAKDDDGLKWADIEQSGSKE